MQTLTIDSKARETLARAASKARQTKPQIKKTSTFGVYTVVGSKGDEYTVTCTSTTHEISCTCPAQKPCYHIAAVANFHSFLVKQAQEAAQVAPVAPATIDYDSPEWQAKIAKDRADLFG